MSKKTDIWMPLYIGDYLADTSHLDAQRHGCYLLWMMHYWRKGPLPNNIDDLITAGKLRDKDAPSIAQALLTEFFVLDSDGTWHQKRQDIEKARWQEKVKKANEKAKRAASVRWKDNAPSNAPSIAQALLTPCPSPSSSTYTSAARKKVRECVSELFDYYCLRVKRNKTQYTLTEKRVAKGISRWEECLAGRTESEAMERFKKAIDNLSSTEYNMENGYYDWIDHLCKNTEEFEKRLNWIKPNGGTNGHYQAESKYQRAEREALEIVAREEADAIKHGAASQHLWGDA